VKVFLANVADQFIASPEHYSIPLSV